MSRKIAEELYEEIKKRNAGNDEKSIPQSDEFIRLMSATLGVGMDTVKKLIDVLVKSHMVFSFEIVHKDELRNTPAVEGYVITDLNAIRRLKSSFQKILVEYYAKEFRKDLMPHQVVKEIFPIIKSLNNTPIGKIANKAIMLEEFDRLLEKEFQNYTASFQDRQLEIELRNANLDGADAKKEVKDLKSRALREDVESGGETPSERAVDSKRYSDFISKKNKYPLQRIINIYGMDFFLKVNLRNYQYGYLKKLIEDGQISKRSDLVMLRDMLRVVKGNVSRDPAIAEHIDEVYELEKALLHKVYFTDKKTKKG